MLQKYHNPQTDDLILLDIMNLTIAINDSFHERYARNISAKTYTTIQRNTELTLNLSSPTDFSDVYNFFSLSKHIKITLPPVLDRMNSAELLMNMKNEQDE